MPTKRTPKSTNRPKRKKSRPAARKATRAATIAEYLARLAPETRSVITTMRAFVNTHIPAGYEEAMNWGVISWQVPLSRLPDTYNGHPLSYIGLGAQKNYNALYLLGEYGPQSPGPQGSLREAFAREGKKLDMGKACIRFRSPDDLALGALAASVSRISVDEYIARYRAVKRK